MSFKIWKLRLAIVETYITYNLKELPAIVDDFNCHFFLVRQP